MFLAKSPSFPSLPTSSATVGMFAIGGAVAGFVGSRLLYHLRRGTRIHSGWLTCGVSVLWALVGWLFSRGRLPPWWVPIPLALTWFAAVLTVVDVRHRRLPDALTLPAYPAIVAATLLAVPLGGGWSVPLGAAVGMAVLCGLHAAVHMASPESLGAGDVKLSGSVGAVLGAVGWPALVFAVGMAAVVTLVLGTLFRRRWRDGIPHAPGLLAATCLVAMFPGPGVAPP